MILIELTCLFKKTYFFCGHIFDSREYFEINSNHLLKCQIFYIFQLSMYNLLILENLLVHLFLEGKTQILQFSKEFDKECLFKICNTYFTNEKRSFG